MPARAPSVEKLRPCADAESGGHLCGFPARIHVLALGSPRLPFDTARCSWRAFPEARPWPRHSSRSAGLWQLPTDICGELWPDKTPTDRTPFVGPTTLRWY